MNAELLVAVHTHPGGVPTVIVDAPPPAFTATFAGFTL
jgi:hypothetical protein